MYFFARAFRYPQNLFMVAPIILLGFYYISMNHSTDDETSDKEAIVVKAPVQTPVAKNAQNCNCTEYLYLNEPERSSVHKFAINSDGSLTEVDPVGFWYPGAGNTSELANPHGLATDISGYLYIGENTTEGSVIRRLDCEGNVYPESEFSLTGNPYSLQSIGNTLYTNSATDSRAFSSYNICALNEVETVCFEVPEEGNFPGGWALHKDQDGNFYTANQYRGGVIFKWTADDYGTGNCVSPLVQGTSADPIFGDDTWTDIGPFGETQSGIPYGITTDATGNVYVVLNETFGTEAKIQKYGPSGNFITETSLDVDDTDGTGWYGAVDILYSTTCDCLYTSNFTSNNDCVSQFDLNLNYIGAAVDPATAVEDNTNIILGKAAALNVECCPINPNETVTQSVCVSSLDEEVFINELYGCDGIVCQSTWNITQNDGNIASGCNESVLLNSPGGCATFTKSYGGSASCGAFSITLNLCIGLPSQPPVMSVTNNNCDNGILGAINLVTPCDEGSTIEYSTDNGTTWTTTLPGYDIEAAQTIIARCVNDSAGCEVMGEAVTTNPDTSCCIPPSGTATTISATCTNGIPADNATLEITTASDATHYDYSIGSSYTGTGFGAATAFDTATDLPLQFGTLANPASTQDYTIRLFNDSDACFTDITVSLAPLVPPATPAISITDNVCPSETGTINVLTPCDANSTLEYSTNGGTTWTASAPTYDVNTPQTVSIRCMDATTGCISEGTAVTSSPSECCPVENCFGILITEN